MRYLARRSVPGQVGAAFYFALLTVNPEQRKIDLLGKNGRSCRNEKTAITDPYAWVSVVLSRGGSAHFDRDSKPSRRGFSIPEPDSFRQQVPIPAARSKRVRSGVQFPYVCGAGCNRMAWGKRLEIRC